MDRSHHEWLEERRPRCMLIGFRKNGGYIGRWKRSYRPDQLLGQSLI